MARQRDQYGRFVKGQGGASIRWGGTLTPALRAARGRLDGAVAATFAYHEQRAIEYMRSNAQWTDQTGNARNGLLAKAFHEPLQKHVLVLYHSVPYGIWLEIRNQGRYAIIEPSIERIGQEIMDTLRDLMRSLRA